MKKYAIIIISLALAHPAFAGNLNVINLSSHAPLKLALSSKVVEHEFSVARNDSSGPFKLKDGPFRLKTTSEDLPELEIPSADAHRIAVIFPVDGSFQWRLLPSKAKTDKWSLRVINFTGEEVKFLHKKEEISIGKADEIQLNVDGRNDVALTLRGGELKSYPHREPCAVIAFLTKSDGVSVVTFILDV